jgi:hypothetical protein
MGAFMPWRPREREATRLLPKVAMQTTRRAARRRPDHGRRQLLNLKHLAERHDRLGTARA